MTLEITKYELLRVLLTSTNLTIKQISALYKLTPYKLKPYINAMRVQRPHSKKCKNVLEDETLLNTISNTLSLSNEQVLDILLPKNKYFVYAIKNIKTNKYLSLYSKFTELSECTSKYETYQSALDEIKSNKDLKVVKLEIKEI